MRQFSSGRTSGFQIPFNTLSQLFQADRLHDVIVRARAQSFAFDPLILILDEATSSVDSALEERIEAALDELMRGRTSLVIAHRLSTIQHADRILVMEAGKIIESGTHDELIAKQGQYATLHRMQFNA